MTNRRHEHGKCEIGDHLLQLDRHQLQDGSNRCRNSQKRRSRSPSVESAGMAEEAIASNPAWKAHYEATKNVPVATPDDIVWADAIIFLTPTRFGIVSSQMKQFLDTTGGIWAQGKTVNKVVSAMTSANNPNGGKRDGFVLVHSDVPLGSDCRCTGIYRSFHPGVRRQPVWHFRDH